MTANDTALQALQAAVTANTTATDAAVAALGSSSGGSDDISAGVNEAAETVAANTASLTAATTPATPPAALSFDPAANVSTALGQPASFSVGTVSGGTPPYNEEVSGLPDGLTASGLNVTGAPTASGTSSLSVLVTDSATSPATATGTVSLTVA